MRNRSHKKILAAFLAAALALMCLAGCGGKPPRTEDKTPVDNAATEQPSAVVETDPPVVEPDPTIESEEPVAEPITRLEVVETMFENAGEPVLDLSKYSNYDELNITDMDMEEPMAVWYAYALVHAGAEELGDGNYALHPGDPTTRGFMARVLLADLTNRAFSYSAVDEGITAYADIAEGSDTYKRNVTYLCISGVLPEMDGGLFCPGEEITADAAEAIFASYGEFLEAHDVAGAIPKQMGTAITLGKSTSAVNLVDDKTEVASNKPEQNTGSQDTTKPEQPSEGGDTTSPEQQPAVIALTDQMASAGFTQMDQGTEYTYITECWDTTDHTAGTVRVSNYSRSDNGDGYETVKVTFVYNFSDDNAKSHGAAAYNGLLDRYTYAEGNAGPAGDIYNNVSGKFSITFNGKDYDKCNAKLVCTKNEWTNNHTIYVIETQYTAVIPKGYDGIVIYTSGYPGEDIEENVTTHLSQSPFTVYVFICN